MFHFGPEQKKGFQSLNAATKVITDASPVVLGAALMQKRNERWVPISYASCSLTSCEHKYSQIEKEALNLVWACERYRADNYGMNLIW